MPAKNKVKFNLKNVHYAAIEAETEAGLTYGPVKAIPGAVNLSLEAQGDIEPFYADGIVYYQSAANDGYSGDLEIALTPDEFREDILREQRLESGVLLENVNAQYKNFALGFQIDGDQNETLFWFYNCSVTRPTTEASTNEGTKTPQTDTLSISCAPAPNGDVRVKTTADVGDEVRRGWFNQVYSGSGSGIGTGADRMKVAPLSYDFGETFNKKASDLIGPNVAIEWSGVQGKVTGDIKKVTDFTGFSNAPEEQSGHYFPIFLDAQYDGKAITVAGSKGDKTTTDLQWIIRLDNIMKSKGGKLKFSTGETEIMTLDFNSADLLEG